MDELYEVIKRMRLAADMQIKENSPRVFFVDSYLAKAIAQQELEPKQFTEESWWR